MVDAVLALPEDTKLMILAPVAREKKGEFTELFAQMQALGYVRVRINGQTFEVEDLPTLKKTEKHNIDVVVDRIKVRSEEDAKARDALRQRLAESFEAALQLAEHRAVALEMDTGKEHLFNAKFSCPVNLYAATKQAFEDILSYYVDAHGLKVMTLALFDTYGPGDPRQKLVSLLWKTALSGQELAMSPGEQLIDIVYIDDVLDAFVVAADLLMEQSEGHLRYGISSGQPIRLIDLAKIFEEASGLTLPISWGGRPYRPREVMKPWSAFVWTTCRRMGWDQP
jgi:hypothetical protein